MNVETLAKIEALTAESITLIERGILKLPENVHSNIAKRLVESLTALAVLQVTGIVEDARQKAMAKNNDKDSTI